jgi:hypothetical protein
VRDGPLSAAKVSGASKGATALTNPIAVTRSGMLTAQANA